MIVSVFLQVLTHHVGLEVTSRDELEKFVQSAVDAAMHKDTSPLAVEETIAQVSGSPLPGYKQLY